jgi:dGTPase
MKLSLRGLRFPVERSRGRHYPELPHRYRNEFQRDRDRIVHARAFRRLENKTQVFGAGLSDHFRNRLTHTIEVAQISRTVASVLELDEDLTEALALAHDIGHPPFAHAGEEELNRQMERFGEHFDHNLHALRLVESFEQRYARFPGLNLTFEVREGIVKHSTDFERGDLPDADEYLPGFRPPLEAQLIDLADEIAYNTADLDDGFSAGLFTAESIANAVPQYAAILEDAEMQFPGATERIRFHETLRCLIDRLVSGLIEGTFTAATEAGVKDIEEVRRYSGRLVRFTPETQATTAALKEFLWRNVYFSGVLLEERRRTTAMLAELFQFFLSHPDRLPSPYCEQAACEHPHRVVCDYIAGMTDGFFHRTYESIAELSGAQPRLL